MTGKRRRRRNRHKRHIGLWRKVRILGQGGNGQVWEVSREGYDNHAAKLLSSSDEITYKRFKDEIHALSNYAIDGLIPLIQSYLPEDITHDKPWYVMPKAVTFYEYAKDKEPLDLAKDFLLLSITLEKLHEQGISHRDIKPANILYYNNRLCFADFGLVKYPGKADVTPKKRDVGAKFTMAPEMRREASDANGLPADVYSLAKTLWIALTKQSKGFDGQYIPNSILGLKNYDNELYLTSLDQLLAKSTDNNVEERPTISSFIVDLEKWIELNKDFEKRNLTEWFELQGKLFPLGTPERTTWTDQNSIIQVINELSKAKSLNHMFFPNHGGHEIIGASAAKEDGFIALHVTERMVELIKPRKLTYESFGVDPSWDYFRLEANEVEPTGIPNSIGYKGISEELTEVYPGVYDSRMCWEHDEYKGFPLPDSARRAQRFLKGSFVFFCTSSAYNRLTGEYDAYDAGHNEISEDDFRAFIKKAAECFASQKTA